MQVEQIIHFILQIDKEYEPISPEERTIASIARFQPRIQSKPQKSKSHYFLTLPPLLINLKYMKWCPILQMLLKKEECLTSVCWWQPVYALIVQLENENRKAFEKKLPILGLFHTLCTFIVAINKHRFGSGVSEALASADLIAAKSIKCAQRKALSESCLSCKLELVYEALQHRLVQKAFFKEYTYQMNWNSNWPL